MVTLDPFHDAVSFARKLFGDRHPFWAKALVDPLEDLGAGNALLWSIDLYGRASEVRSFRGSYEQHQTWLRDAKDLARKGDALPADCEERALEIWFSDPQFNRFERGISRLFTALQSLAQKNIKEYKFQVISSVGMLADAGDERFDPSTLEMATTSFQQLSGRLEHENEQDIG